MDDAPRGAEAWVTGSATGEEASGRDSGDGNPGALRDRSPALEEAAG